MALSRSRCRLSLAWAAVVFAGLYLAWLPLRSQPTVRQRSIDYPQPSLANRFKHALGSGVILVAEGGLAKQYIHQFSLHLATNAAIGKDLIDEGFEGLARGLRHGDDLS
jgi:hypothetical protein